MCLTGVPIGGRRVVYAQWRDIEKRKRAEEALIIRRLHLSEAMDLAKIVYWELTTRRKPFFSTILSMPFTAPPPSRRAATGWLREEY